MDQLGGFVDTVIFLSQMATEPVLRLSATLLSDISLLWVFDENGPGLFYPTVQ